MTAALGFMSSSGNGLFQLGSLTNLSLNGTGIGIAFLCQAHTTDPIARVRFRHRLRTGTPPEYKVTLEGLDASSNPNGTDLGGGSPTLKAFTPPASTAWDDTMQEITLTNSWTPAAKGTLFYITIRYSSGTCDGSNFSSITRFLDGHFAANMASVHIPNHSTLSGGAWTRSTNAGIIAWGTSGALFGRPLLTAYTTATAATAGHRSGAYFTLPSGFGATYDVEGVTIMAILPVTSFKVSIWNTAGTVLATTNTILSNASQNYSGQRALRVKFNAVATLTYGTKYYIGLEVVVAGGSGVCALGQNFATAEEAAITPMGANSGLVTWNGTTWTETTTTIPLFELHFSDIMAPAGGGGSALHLGGLGQTGIGVF